MAQFGIIGSAGRMGHALVAAIAEGGHAYAGGVDKGDDVGALAAASLSPMGMVASPPNPCCVCAKFFLTLGRRTPPPPSGSRQPPRRTGDVPFVTYL